MTRILLAVAVMAGVTLLTRAAPFLFFSKRKPPAVLDYLQRFIPPVVMTLLVLASFKDIRFAEAPHGLPALLGAAATALLHFWKRNVLLSIAGGTALYMILIRLT